MDVNKVLRDHSNPIRSGQLEQDIHGQKVRTGNYWTATIPVIPARASRVFFFLEGITLAFQYVVMLRNEITGASL